MENRFLSFVLDEERSTYTEGESKSRRSSILKPPKARAPLQEVNLGGSADDTEDFDTLRKRRVSFAGVNSVKEFCSQAESLQVCHIQSYEETFSTSSDNSQNNSAKSLLQVGTPKHAVSSGEDHNFADDPMDLTDSIIDNNHVADKSAPPPVVQVIPVFTPSAQLSESGMNNRDNLPSWGSRKSLSQRPVIDGNTTSSNMSISSVVGVPPLGTPRNPDAPVAVSSPWSCSMDMTEPVHGQHNRISSVNMPSTQDKIPILPFRNSFKVAEQSDHGMELTEAVLVKIKPFSINQANDNFGDMSMEMTEVVKRTELESFRSRVSFTNKSASMEFTEVVHPQRKSSQFPHFHQSGIESSTGNCGMELTEPIKAHFMSSNPSERLPSEQIISGKSHSALSQSHHVTPFPRGPENPGDCEKSILETTSNHSLCDMEMTGVLSLSKYNKIVSNDDDADDMDFTQMLSVNERQNKKARMSNEPDEEPFQIISPLSTKVCDVQQPLHQNEPLRSRHSIPPSPARDELKSLAEPLAPKADTIVTEKTNLTMKILLPSILRILDERTVQLSYHS
uniref:Uncharacterized protein n=1 Tax=Lygus hesperus TaxID=30085 RepID=A0A0K8T003_LYGHE